MKDKFSKFLTVVSVISVIIVIGMLLYWIWDIINQSRDEKAAKDAIKSFKEEVL